MTWRAAAQYSGVSYASIMEYKRWGQEAMEKVAANLATLDPEYWARIDALDDDYRPDGGPTARDLELEQMLPARSRPHFRLWRAIERAVAFFELRNLTLVQEAARGYDEQETVTVTKRDAQGRAVEETSTEKRRRNRHWQAAGWM